MTERLQKIIKDSDTRFLKKKAYIDYIEELEKEIKRLYLERELRKQSKSPKK